ncbi:hypothetical protein [Hymenobacter psychrophilus]|uniref:Uncharacterized protein n=1 Tax=Hymenobacter psychrophilus TaxID=651662 RepID=A0A1H3GNJ4_9BACT|nr:hypothetical protein [Hymenobacter psychrophilus]SDY04687.1 hypothetical protein SAMN04488069_105100 [Hymenobacter psychrophilus]
MLLLPTRFMYPVSAVQLQERHGLLPAEFLPVIEQLRPFLEKEQAYGEVCTTTAESAKGRTLLVSYRKSYAAEQGFVVEILDIEVVAPLARAA